MRDVLEILIVRRCSSHVSEAVLESLVREDEHVVRVGDLCAVDHECVRIDVRLLRLYSE